MKIEDVEKLAEMRRADKVHGDLGTRHRGWLIDKALSALRAEAWYPIERAEEMGVKDGQEVLIALPNGEVNMVWWDKDLWRFDQFSYYPDGDPQISHFKRISPPEAK